MGIGNRIKVMAKTNELIIYNILIDSQDRFILRLQPSSVDINTINDDNSQIDIRLMDNVLAIDFEDINDIEDQVLISNTLGQVIGQFKLETGLKEYRFSVKHLLINQVYFVTLQEQIITRKIIK